MEIEFGRRTAGIGVAPKYGLQFSGDRDDWPRFRNLFMIYYHNRMDMPEAQKLERLRHCLKGDALICAVGTAAHDDQMTYEKAWQTLNERYNNISLRQYARFISSLPIISPFDASRLDFLLSAIKQYSELFPNHNDSKKAWNASLILSIYNKLDHASKEAWKEYSSTLDTISINHLIHFLECRSRAMASDSPSRPSKLLGNAKSWTKSIDNDTSLKHRSVQPDKCKFNDDTMGSDGGQLGDIAGTKRGENVCRVANATVKANYSAHQTSSLIALLDRNYRSNGDRETSHPKPYPMSTTD